MAQTKWHQIERSGHPAGLWAVMMAVLMAGMMMSPPASAADGKRVAFVVGIGTYDKFPSHEQLTNPLNDAEGVSKKLANLGFQVEKAINLSRSDFNDRWENVLDRLTEEDTFVLYFSGHGVQIDGLNYLLPRDIRYFSHNQPKRLTSDAISLNGLLADLSTGDQRHPKRSVVILDACRADPFIPQGSKSRATSGGLATLRDPKGVFVIYAAASNEIALDKLSPSDPEKYSVFTRALLPLMERRDLTIQQLSTELKEQVAKLAEDAGHEQQPAYYDGIRGQFCLPGCGNKTDKGTVGLSESLDVSVRSALPKAITGKDGTPMVLIPAGEFWMGSLDGDRDERPRHLVSLDAFYMDKFEVMVARYADFFTRSENRKNRSKPEYWDQASSKHLNLPVVGVDWDDAEAYCRWFGKRLPTEAEWEKAARGTNERTYPWGNEQPTPRLANFVKESTIIENVYDKFLAPVDSYERGKSPYGLHHMAGNVWEWTADWYDEDFYAKSPQRNPTGPSSGKYEYDNYRVIRGGSWDVLPGYVRSAKRKWNEPTGWFSDIGFRCAQDPPK